METREVPEDEFFKAIGPLDVHPKIVDGKWPWVSIFQTRNGREVGRIVPAGSGRPVDYKYYLGV